MMNNYEHQIERREKYASKLVNFGYLFLVVGSIVASYIEFNKITHNSERFNLGISLIDKIKGE